MDTKREKEQKLTMTEQMRNDTRIFNAQSRVFAGDIPDRIIKYGKELDYMTVKGNDLPRIELIQAGELFEGNFGYVWRVCGYSKTDPHPRIRPMYRFKKIDNYGIHIIYSKRSEVEFYFNSEKSVMIISMSLSMVVKFNRDLGLL